jgi:hypothetical protein
MKKTPLIVASLLFTILLAGCATKEKSIDPTIKTRDEVLNPVKYYTPEGMDVEVKLTSTSMTIFEIVDLVKTRTGYEFQIYDKEQVGHYRVKFDEENLKLTPLQIIQTLDKQYGDKLDTLIDEDAKYITIKTKN